MKKNIITKPRLSGKADSRHFKITGLQRGDASWVFELLGWDKHVKQRK